MTAAPAHPERPGGELTIFFGAARGVGKTYAMLEVARQEVERGRDVVLGVVETHGRYDVGALVLGFELVPRADGELDLEAALARRPQLVVVDELAHANPPGARHRYRWQDVEELLAVGVDVFATLDVQQLESLADVVAPVTGVAAGDTVPDTVFDRAQRVRLVDLPVEGNLIALRELALRRTAERVDAQLQGYKAEQGIERAWHTGERVLVCLSSSPYGPRLVRAARRMATSLHAELVGAHVETPSAARASARDRERLAETMRLCEKLGGEAVTLRGDDAAEEIVRYARRRDVTKIVLGKPKHPRWRDLLLPPFLDRVVRSSDDIDVHVISGLGDEAREPRVAAQPARAWRGYGAAGAVVGAVTAIAWWVFGRGRDADIVMTYLLGVVVVAMRFGYGPSLAAAVLGVLAFDVFFVPPYLRLEVADLRHVVTFAVFLVVALVLSHLTRRIREQADSARDRERRTATLYALSRELGRAPSRARMLEVAARHMRDMLDAKVAILVPGSDGVLAPTLADDGAFVGAAEELRAAEWTWAHQRPCGAGTDTLPGRAAFVPLRGALGRAGVLAFVPTRDAVAADRRLVETASDLVGSAIERFQLADEARAAQLRVEAEQMRNALLSSVSHDLRTPLGVVTGATSALLGPDAPKGERERRELVRTAHAEAERLARLVDDLLDMTRLESGTLRVSREPQPLEEVLGAALNHVEPRLEGRAVTTAIPDDLPLVSIDAALVEQVLVNLLENAVKYTPSGAPIHVGARPRDAREVEVEVADRGPGVPPEHAEKVFDKFHRVREGEGGGVGLGLTICRGIVQAHGGRIWVEPRAGGGASFRFTLPCGRAAAPVHAEAAERERA